MLVLSRKLGEEIRIGRNIRLTVLAIRGNRVRLGLTAPPDVTILRTELDTRRQDFSTHVQPSVAGKEET